MELHRNFISGRKGFTLIELLLSISIISIIAAIVVTAINPSKQFASARDAQRNSDTHNILNAIGQYAIDNIGDMPCNGASVCVDENWRQLGGAINGCDTIGVLCGGMTVEPTCLLLSDLANTYLADIPVDPRYGEGESGLDANSRTGYIVRSEDTRVTVRSCRPEQTATIEFSR